MTTDTVCYRTSTDVEGVLIPTSTDCTSQVIYYAPWKWNTISTNSRNSSGKECEIKLLFSPFVLIQWYFRMDGKLDSSASTVNRPLAGQLRNQGSISDRAEDFLLFAMYSPAVGLNQTCSVQWIPRTPSSGVKRARSECDHPPPSNADGKNVWIFIFTPSYVFVLINP